MIDEKQWAFGVLGAKYEKGAGGPERFDCWGLVRNYFEKVRGIELESFPLVDPSNVKACAEAINRETGKENWIEVADALSGDVVGMSQNKVLHHVGVWIKTECGGVCIHAQDSDYVVAQDLRQLKFSTIRFFRHV